MKTVVAAILAIAVAGPALAQSQTAHTDDLLNFDWLSDDQRQRVEQAHSQLASAQREMCDLMVEIYAEHAQRVHESEVDGQDLAYLKRSCAAKSFSGHIEMSVHLHDRIHREAHQAE